MASRNDRRRRSLLFAVITGTIGTAGAFSSMESSGAVSPTSALLNNATSTTTATPLTTKPFGTASTLTVVGPTTTLSPKRKSNRPVSRLPLAVTSDSSGRTLALNEMPDGWTARPVNAAAAPFDCRHLQPAMGAPVRTERVGFLGPEGQSVIERIDVFRDELAALRSRDRLVERLNTCTTASFTVETETFRFERQAISVQSDTGPDSIAAWRESMFDASPVGESEFFFLLASGPTVVSLWTSTERPVSDHRALLTTAASVAFEVTSCKVTWKAKGLRRCSDGRLDLDGRRVFGSGTIASDEFELYPGRFLSSQPARSRNSPAAESETSRTTFSFRGGVSLTVACRAASCRGALSPMPRSAIEPLAPKTIPPLPKTTATPPAVPTMPAVTAAPVATSTTPPVTTTSTTRPTTSTTSTTTSTTRPSTTTTSTTTTSTTLPTTTSTTTAPTSTTSTSTTTTTTSTTTSTTSTTSTTTTTTTTTTTVP